jgi:hypothetical protein
MMAVALMILASTGALVGRWDVETRSRGGIGTWIELSANGVCSGTTGAMVDGRWKLEGNQLTLVTDNGDGSSQSQVATISIAGKMQTQVLPTETRRLLRVGVQERGTGSIAGVWSYAHPAGGQAYEEYTTDGRFLFRLPIRTIPCTWSAEADRLEIREGIDVRKYAWDIEKSRLTLQSGGERMIFRRERGGIIPAAQRR